MIKTKLNINKLLQTLCNILHLLTIFEYSCPELGGHTGGFEVERVMDVPEIGDMVRASRSVKGPRFVVKAEVRSTRKPRLQARGTGVRIVLGLMVRDGLLSFASC
jgi:hypothetical protein